MSLFPDVRNDDTYNDHFLEDRDEQFLAGYDMAYDEIINLIANNLDTYEGELNELCPDGYEMDEDEAFSKREDLYQILEENREILCAVIKDWLEMSRNELVTSMIDDMDESVYETVKKDVLERQPELRDKLYDTRKFMVTGKRETDNREGKQE
jgi:hypothetical protein